MIHTFSDWRKKTERWATAATRQLDEQGVGALKTVGNEIAARVRDKIRRQKIDGPPLAQATVDKKGHDTKLIDEGEYLASLHVTAGRRTGSGRKLFLITQVESETRTPELAIFMEFGTSTIPARPHWRPAMAEVRRGEVMRAFLKGKWFALTFANTEKSG